MIRRLNQGLLANISMGTCVADENKKDSGYTLVNVYVDLVVFTRIAGTS